MRSSCFSASSGLVVSTTTSSAASPGFWKSVRLLIDTQLRPPFSRIMRTVGFCESDTAAA